MLRSIGIAVASLVLCLGCATFRPLPDDPDFKLASDEGILVVHTATDVPVVSISVGHDPVVEGLRSGVRYEFLVAKAGAYRWTRILLGTRPTRSGLYWRQGFTFTDTRDYWDFQVKPGVINYPGQVEVYLNRESGVPSARLANRSGLMWIILRDRFPDLISRYPVVYTGALRDDFFEHVRSASDGQSTRATE